MTIGKNPLWVTKQHGHSIATMLRAYAAWAEGTAEVDVEAIKRSMNTSEAPPTRNLAVNLSVAEALQTKRALALRSPQKISPCTNRLFRHRKVAVNQTTDKLAGVAGLFGPDGPHPFGAALRALTRWDNLDRVATTRDRQLEPYDRAAPGVILAAVTRT